MHTYTFRNSRDEITNELAALLRERDVDQVHVVTYGYDGPDETSFRHRGHAAHVIGYLPTSRRMAGRRTCTRTPDTCSQPANLHHQPT